jgi:hypothetical protein
MHILEVYGVSKFDDVNLGAWSFGVDDMDWETFTLSGLDNYRVEPQIEGDTVIWFGEWTVNQPDD